MAFITVQELVKTVINTIPEPYGPDIVDKVFQAIEGNPEWLEEYNRFVTDHGKPEVDNSIGFNVMSVTGMKSMDRERPATSSLIENYTELGKATEQNRVE